MGRSRPRAAPAGSSERGRHERQTERAGIGRNVEGLVSNSATTSQRAQPYGGDETDYRAGARQHEPLRTNIRLELPRLAPSADRMPSSRVRCEDE